MKKNKHTYTIIGLIVGTTLLSGCDKLRHTFGLDHTQGDPFIVPTNPPLSMPPNYELRPPLPGAKNPGETDPQDQAHQKMLGNKRSLTQGSQATEKNLISTASKTGVPDPEIRHKVSDESSDGESFLDKLKNIGSRAKENITKGSQGEDFRTEEAAPKQYEIEQQAHRAG